MSQGFGKYQLLKKLATGGMAEVWLARQTGIEGFNRLLVVKRILPHLADDPEFVQMFLNEAKIAARFNHPNIAQIYDLGETSGTYFIAMEFVHGEDLGRLMRKAWSTGQWIARPLAIRIIASACEGLYYAHSKAEESGKPLRVVHRDISPQNILISFEGGVKLVDFGIAKAADQASMTKSGAIKGKFAYMSPEQAAGKTLDHRADIFSLGLVLYELLTGQRPLKRESELGTLQAALECAIEAPSAVADVPSELDGAVMRALAKSADDRYRDAREFQMALEELLVRQRWVATSVQVSELMSTLFADRLKEELKLGRPDPASDDRPISGSSPRSEAAQSHNAATAQATPSALSQPPELERRQVPSEMSWDAPPGEPGFIERRRGPRPARAPRRTSSKSLPAGTDEPGSVTDAPRHSSQARAPSLPETRLREPTPARPSARVSPGIDESLAPLENVSQLPRPRTRSAPSLAQGTPVAEPEAPARRPSDPRPAPRKLIKEALPVELQQPLEITSYVDPDVQRTKLLRWGALAVAALLLIGALAFRQKLWSTLSHTAMDGQGIYLTVHSDPKAEVYVKHPPAENPIELQTSLGQTPLNAVRGAHVRDTLVLVNLDQGLFYEEEIRFGEPNKLLKIEKTFVKGKAVISLTPANLAGLSFFRNGLEVGKYSPGLSMELYEGKNELEVRGGPLKKPVPFEVTVLPNARVEKTVDLSEAL